MIQKDSLVQRIAHEIIPIRIAEGNIRGQPATELLLTLGYWDNSGIAIKAEVNEIFFSYNKESYSDTIIGIEKFEYLKNAVNNGRYELVIFPNKAFINAR